MYGYASYSLIKTERVVTEGVTICVHDSFLNTEVVNVIENEASPKGIHIIANDESPELRSTKLETGVNVEISHVEIKFLFTCFIIVRVAVFCERDILVSYALAKQKPDSECNVVQSHHQVVDRLISSPSSFKVGNVFGSGINHRFEKTPQNVIV